MTTSIRLRVRVFFAQLVVYSIPNKNAIEIILYVPIQKTHAATLHIPFQERLRSFRRCARTSDRKDRSEIRNIRLAGQTRRTQGGGVESGSWRLRTSRRVQALRTECNVRAIRAFCTRPALPETRHAGTDRFPTGICYAPKKEAYRQRTQRRRREPRRSNTHIPLRSAQRAFSLHLTRESTSSVSKSG